MSTERGRESKVDAITRGSTTGGYWPFYWPYEPPHYVPPFAPSGWRCPGCGRYYSPSTYTCYYCLPPYAWPPIVPAVTTTRVEIDPSAVKTDPVHVRTASASSVPQPDGADRNYL